MKSQRTMLWLFLAAVMSVAANVFLSYRRPIVPALSDRAPVGSSFDVAKIEIARQGEPTTVLEKDYQWRLVSPFTGSVDVQVVLKMLDEFAIAMVEDALTESEILRLGRSRDDFGLSEPRLKVTLTNKAGDKREIAFGIATPSAAGVYASLNGSGVIMVLPNSLFAAANLSTDEIRERHVFGYGPDYITGFDLKRPGEAQVSFVRDAAAWKMGGGVASEKKITELLSFIVDARAKSFVWPVVATNKSNVASSALLSSYGLDPESSLSVNLRCRDGVDRRVVLGNDAGHSEVYALVHNGAAVVTLDKSLREAAAQNLQAFMDTRLFPFAEASVSAFTIIDHETTYVVARGKDGVWKLESPLSAPADQEFAGLILARLLALTQNEVSADGLKVSVSNTSDSFMVADAELLSGRGLENLRSKDILKIDPTLLRRIVSDGSLVYSRERKIWSVEREGDGDKIVNDRNLKSVIAALSPLRAQRIVTLKASAADLSRYGLETPFYTVAVDQDRVGSMRRNILIGGQTLGGRYATVGSSEAVFVLSEKTVSILTAPLIGE